VPTAEKHSPKSTTAKPTAAQNAKKKATKKKPTKDGANGTEKTNKHYTKNN